MSKSNVNPNHYKVAGRERQGEDIAHARHRQAHAENVVRQRAENGARAGKPVPEAGPALPAAGTARSAPRARLAKAAAADVPPPDAGRVTKRASVREPRADARDNGAAPRKASSPPRRPTRT